MDLATMSFGLAKRSVDRCLALKLFFQQQMYFQVSPIAYKIYLNLTKYVCIQSHGHRLQKF